MTDDSGQGFGTSSDCGPTTRRDTSFGTTRDGTMPRIVRSGRGADAGLPPTARDQRPATARDGWPPTACDNAHPEPGSNQPSGGSIRLPDYLDADYVVIDELTTGGESVVALVQHRETGDLKVIKIYHRGITLPETLAATLASTDPRHVLPVARSIYTGWFTPRFVESMDYLEAGSLEKLLQDSGGSVPTLAPVILVEMTDALEYIHQQLGIVHRDIKPANILIRQREPLDLVVADLGIASELAEIRRSRRETSGGVKGTLVYQAPETLNESNAGPPRDWWALGMTMCEVLTGRHPFKDSRGRLLHDEGKIRNAITMGEIDLSMVTDDRWNLLCRGLLVHHPHDRWGGRQVRRWLAGETPDVAAPRFKQPRRREVRRYRFAGERFSDPVELASHMAEHWGQAEAVFTSTSECDALRAWIREDVNDPSIDVNLLTPVPGGDQPQIDARIIEFTAHYLGCDRVTLHGASVNSRGLAHRLIQAGESWADDPILSALAEPVVAALVEAQLDEDAGPDGQSAEYYALARLVRYADDVDRVIDVMESRISAAASERVEGTDVGADVRDGLPRRLRRAQGLARAALLSPAAAAGIRDEFRDLNYVDTVWFTDLCESARRPESDIRGLEADPSELALKSLAMTVSDLADLHSQSTAAARVEAEHARQAQRERQRAAAIAAENAHEAELERQREIAIRARVSRRLDLDRRFVAWAATLCVTVLVPLGVGYFLMTKTPLLKSDPAVWNGAVRKFSDHFPAYYIAGVVPILFILAVALLWPPLARRPLSVGVGVAALIGALVVSSWASGAWEKAEAAAAERLSSTAYPFRNEYYTCGFIPFDLRFRNGTHEMWQVHTAQENGFPGQECNRIEVYRGWMRKGVFTLPDGDTFDPTADWDGADISRGGLTLSDIWVNMKTARGGNLHFTLAGAQNNIFELTYPSRS